MSENSASDARKARLAEALRENLKRRKAQSRARSTAGREPPAPESAAVNPPQIPPKERG